MSIPFVPGLEKGVSLEGNIEITADDLKSFEIEFDENFKQDKVTQSDILDFGDEGFLLHNILTEEECQDCIQKAEEAGFEAIRGVRDDYRSCTRITLESKALSDVLWSRIKNFVHDISIDGDPHKHHIHGPVSLMKGTWTPVGLNSLFRLCRYLPGGHFAPHFDGHFDKSCSERSLKTFMVYLNGNFTGGATNFVNEQQTLYMDEASGKYCAEQKNILHSMQPQTGLAIVFNHFRLHEGAQLREGQKYILRTDVMFRNTSQQLSEEYSRAVNLIQQAETLENAGECMKAAELYRKAFKLAPELEQSC